MRKTALLMIFVLAIFIFVGVMMGQSMLILQRVAAVSQAHGTVSIRSQGQQDFQPLAGRERVAAGDTLRTGPDSSVDLSWIDGTRIRLAPNTTMTVRKCAINKANEAETSVFDLGIGRIWVRVLKVLSQKSKFEVRTPTATAGVRSTIFSVEVDAAGKTSVSVDEGAVSLSSGGQRAEVVADQVAQVAAGTIAALPMTDAEASQWQRVEDIKGPLLQVMTPTPETALIPGLSIGVSGVVEPGAQVTVNCDPVPVDHRGRFAVEVPTPANVQEFGIDIVATDAHSHTTTVTRTLKARS